MNHVTKVRLQSAYVATLLSHKMTGSFDQGQEKIFDHGQEKIFRDYLERQKIISEDYAKELTRDRKYMDLLTHWFIGRFIISAKPYSEREEVTNLLKAVASRAEMPREKVHEWFMDEAIYAKFAPQRRNSNFK